MAHQWYIRSGVKEQGPFSSAQLKKLAEQRRIKQDSIVRRGEVGKWVHALKVKGLFPPTQSTGQPVEEVAEASPSDRDLDATEQTEAPSSSRRNRLVVIGSVITAFLILVSLFLFYSFRLPREIRDLLVAVNDVEVEMKYANGGLFDAVVTLSLRDPGWPTVLVAMQQIKGLGSEELAVQELERLLRSKSLIRTEEAEFVCAKALRALGELGQDSVEALPLIEKLLHSPRDRIKKAAQDALIQIKSVKE